MRRFRSTSPGSLPTAYWHFTSPTAIINLEPVLAKLAEQAHLTALIRRDRVPDDESANGKTSSDWLVMGRRAEDLGALATDAKWAPAATNPRVALWTDDFSNILAVLSKR